ncbi:hypothetical protein, partial [Lactobacillus hamsteri]|uniref:hypothetical protein n=1 Tax=Lactobacillus hamsteri TaxID=96565 RepID=UPI003CD0925C
PIKLKLRVGMIVFQYLRVSYFPDTFLCLKYVSHILPFYLKNEIYFFIIICYFIVNQKALHESKKHILIYHLCNYQF